MNFGSSPIVQRFFAVYSDGRTEAVESVTVLDGEVLGDAMSRKADELGAEYVYLEEAKVSAE